MTLDRPVGRRRSRWVRRNTELLVIAGHEMGLRGYYAAWNLLDSCPDAKVLGIDVDGELHSVRISEHPLWWRRELEFIPGRRPYR